MIFSQEGGREFFFLIMDHGSCPSRSPWTLNALGEILKGEGLQFTSPCLEGILQW